eukprot:296277-Prymnesium_polylepis.1
MRECKETLQRTVQSFKCHTSSEKKPWWFDMTKHPPWVKHNKLWYYTLKDSTDSSTDSSISHYNAEAVDFARHRNVCLGKADLFYETVCCESYTKIAKTAT